MRRSRYEPTLLSPLGRLACAVAVLAAPALAAAQPAGPPAASATAPSAPPPPVAAPAATAPEAPAPSASSAPSAPDAERVPTAAEKEEARSHFEKGLALMGEDAWAAALAEFLLSIELYPTRNARINSAACYQKLQRFDDALDSYEELLRAYPNLPADDKVLAQRAITELRTRVGTFDVVGGEPGATIVVSGQTRGELPLVAPLRAAAGSHVVRIFKEGFEPFETRVDLAGGQTARVEVKLVKLSASGRLKITEAGGRLVEVVVDGVALGNAPWEGLTSVGNHVVLLREPGGRGRFGTQPVVAAVKSGEVTTLSLRAQELDSALRVEPRPPGAHVFINGVDVGGGQWVGRLRSGKHKIEIYEEGFQRETREITLVSGGRELVAVDLKRDDDAPRWKKPSRWVGEASVGLALGPGFGGDGADGCTGSCSSGVVLGPSVMVHGAYELGSGFGVGLSAGYLLAFHEIRDRSAPFVVHPESSGQTKDALVDDALRLQAALLGGHISYRLGSEVFPFVIRLGGGVAPGQLRVDRRGSLAAPDGAGAFSLDAAAVSTSAVMAFIAPEVRLGWRFAERFEATLGLRALVLIAPQSPKWNDLSPLNAGPGYGEGRYGEESLTGQAIVTILPTLGIRYDVLQ